MKKLLVLLIFMPMLIGLNNLTDGYRIPAAGGSTRIYAKDGNTQGACYTIQNNHATNDLFVSTKSISEWTSFIAGTPTFAAKTLCQPKSCLEIKNLMGSPADGSVGSGGWFYAIGSQQMWGTTTPGMPASDDVAGAPDKGVPRVQLWVK